MKEKSHSTEDAQERLYQALVKSTDDYPYICDMKTGVFRYAPAMVEEFDLPGEMIDHAAAVWESRIHENDRAAFLEANQAILDGRTRFHCVEYRVKNRHGEWVWVRCRGHVEVDETEEPVLFAGFITNLEKKNKIDHLTGMFNKLEFEELICRQISHHRDQPFTVMVLGIDDLKHINDLYDRTFGDQVIRIIAQKIQILLPTGVLLCRLDGDEFGIMIPQKSSGEMQKLFHTISYCFENQQKYKGKKYYCTLSGGIVEYPGDAADYLTIMKYAGYALEYAKRHGKKCCISYSSGLQDNRSRALEMLEEIRASIEDDYRGFSLMFQPLVEASSGRLLGAEVLARWQCQRFGEVSPVEFIPLLEQSGLILPVGKWVISTAFKQCVKWVCQMPDFVLDINLSYLQIQGTDYLPFLMGALDDYQFPAANLVLELTESCFVQKEYVTDIFERICEKGIRIAMDDFGTGYSTLSLLKEKPADIVKIDKTFIRDIRSSTFDATFIRFAVELCHDAGIKVCLEGVETEEEYQIVADMNLDMIQGFYFGYPLTADRFEQCFVQNHL